MKLDKIDIKTTEVLEWKGVHLFHFQGSACSQKLRIFLNYKNIDWVSHEVNLIKGDNFSEWYLGINPRGLVPTLVHNGDVHIESNDIMTYLDQEFPNTKLFPTNLIDDIKKDLDYEDSLHFDLRRLTFRYLVPHILGKKDPKKTDFKESHDGTIQGQNDAYKEKEISFWKKHYDHGITDDEVIESGNKFKDIYSKFDSILKNQNFLKGDEFTIVDLAWYVSTKRLYAAGVPIDKYKNVKNWFDKLDNDNNFNKEANPIFILKITKVILKIYNKLKGKYLTDLVDF